MEEDIEALIRTIEEDEREQCQLIVRKYGREIIIADYMGTTALHWAAYKNRSEIVEWFLQQGIHCDTLNIVCALSLY
eukprot:m.195840 g.195840  ORF g.195840 m.195840 type:complete len:77 (-) comp53732_c1_seq5:162-392(-)